MLDLTYLGEFSRTHCIAICSVLVPANLLATSQTLWMAWRQRPLRQLYLMAIVACLYSAVMVLHVMTWLWIGVVMLPTFVLFGLGCTCLLSNGAAIAYAHYRLHQQQSLLQRVGSPVRSC
jgi:uncharacterized membrane protein YdbT with pleckstrin-like domain